MDIPFIDLKAQQARIKPAIDAGIQAVLAHGRYIMGPEVAELEQQLSAFCGAAHTLTCANGTDALQLALMALAVGPGDAVFVPAFTFAATAEVVPLVGATPVFVDVDRDTFDLDAASLSRAIDEARRLQLRPRAVIAVDLFGLPADYDAITAVAESASVYVISDTAQGFGGTYRGRRTGAIGHVATTSFFPAKPLGCYGDGGAIFTGDAALASLIDSLRVHGKGAHKYDNARIGINSRLDTLQAAILLAKLAIYEDELRVRRQVAARYDQGLSDVVETPTIPSGLQSTFAQYTVKLPVGADRAAVQAGLKEHGIPTAVYYSRPLHQQTAYRSFVRDPAGLPVSEALSQRVLSLPMHAYLSYDAQDRVIERLQACVRGSGR